MRARVSSWVQQGTENLRGGVGAAGADMGVVVEREKMWWRRGRWRWRWRWEVEKGEKGTTNRRIPFVAVHETTSFCLWMR